MKASPVAPVGERCDDQSTCVTQVLVGVRHRGGDHLDLNQLLDEVVAKLADPGEVVHTAGLNFIEVGHHISC